MRTATDPIRWRLVVAQAVANATDPWRAPDAKSDPDRQIAYWRAVKMLREFQPLTMKEQLLAHYAKSRVTDWSQFDAAHQPGGDGLASDDGDGDIMYGTTARELWHGTFPVRVHVLRGTDPETAARLLHKVADEIAKGGLADPTEDRWAGAESATGVRGDVYPDDEAPF